MKYVLLSLGFLVVFFLLVKLLLPNLSDTDCILKQEFIGNQYIGVVKDKYVDVSQHSYPIIKILDSRDSVLTLNLVMEKTGLYDKIEVGQHIYKPKGNDTVFLLAQGKKITLGKADFGCR